MDEISPEVLKKASLGDIVAFEQIYKSTSGFVYNVALGVTRNQADAQEVTQDVFMKVYRNLKNFRFRAKIKTWIYRITVNTAINRYHQSRRTDKGRVDKDNLIENIAAKEGCEEAIAQSDNASRLNVLLGKLSAKHRACLVLRELQGLDYREISAALNIPLNTVRSRLKRAREALLKEVVGEGA